MDIKTLIGKRILELRLINNFSQRELEIRADISNGQIATLESGNSMPKIDTLIKIAKALNTKVDYFIQDITEEYIDIVDNEFWYVYQSLDDKSKRFLKEMAKLIRDKKLI